MKIKQKKQLNLPQLIEWAWDNDDATGVRFQSDGFVTTVYFGKNGDVSVEDCSKDARFTLEVEEVVDEDTKFRHIVFIDDCGLSASWGNSSINDIKYGKDKEYHAYIDGEFRCIWRDGGLIE